jgi:hypothetical protein
MSSKKEMSLANGISTNTHSESTADLAAEACACPVTRDRRTREELDGKKTRVQVTCHKKKTYTTWPVIAVWLIC